MSQSVDFLFIMLMSGTNSKEIRLCAMIDRFAHVRSTASSMTYVREASTENVLLRRENASTDDDFDDALQKD